MKLKCKRSKSKKDIYYRIENEVKSLNEVQRIIGISKQRMINATNLLSELGLLNFCSRDEYLKQ